MEHTDWDHRYAAHAHDHHAKPRPTAPELAGFLAGAATLPAQAVDLGCGAGDDAMFLAERGIQTIGVDSSAAALELAGRRAAERGIEVAWVQASVLDLPLEDASVDLAHDHGCLHHVEPSDRPAYAAEVARVLRPGGTLLVRDILHSGGGHHGPTTTEADVLELFADTALHVRTVVAFDLRDNVRAILTTLDRQ